MAYSKNYLFIDNQELKQLISRRFNIKIIDIALDKHTPFSIKVEYAQIMPQTTETTNKMSSLDKIDAGLKNLGFIN